MSNRQLESNRKLLIGSLAIFGLAFTALLYGFASRALTQRIDPYRESTSQLVGDIIQVSVRNGCGISGLAGDMTHYLRKHGFDVVEVGDYSSFDQEYTFVYDRIGDIESAKKLARTVGLPDERVIQDIDLEEYLDATIVIGKDYKSLTPFNAQPQPVNQ